VAVGVVFAVSVNHLLMAQLSLRLLHARWGDLLFAHLPAVGVAGVVALVIWPIAVSSRVTGHRFQQSFYSAWPWAPRRRRSCSHVSRPSFRLARRWPGLWPTSCVWSRVLSGGAATLLLGRRYLLLADAGSLTAARGLATLPKE
jgi:hypothetical protein